MGNNRLLLTPSEVAKVLKLNLLTIYKYIRTGQLAAVKFGRTYRVFEKDLDSFIDRKRVN